VAVEGTIAKTEFNTKESYDSIKNTVLYDGDGIISVTRVNSAGDSEIIEYQVYNKDKHSYDTIFNKSGAASSRTTVKFVRAGSSTLGYEVTSPDKITNPISLIISEDGNVSIKNAKSGTDIAKINYTNTAGTYAGAKFVTVYTADGYKVIESNELRLTDGTRIVMQQIEDGSWYGVRVYTISGIINTSGYSSPESMHEYDDGYGHGNASTVRDEDKRDVLNSLKYGDFGYGNSIRYYGESEPPEGIDFEATSLDDYSGLDNGTITIQKNGDYGYRFQYQGYDLIRLTFNVDAAGNAKNAGEYFQINDPFKGSGALTVKNAYSNTYSLNTTSENVQKAWTFSISKDGKLSIDSELKKFRAWSNQRGAEVWSDFAGATSLGEYTFVEGSYTNAGSSQKETEYFLMKNDGTFQVLHDKMEIGTDIIIHSKDKIDELKKNGIVGDYNKEVIDKADEWLIQITGPPLELQETAFASRGEFSKHDKDNFGNVFALGHSFDLNGNKTLEIQTIKDTNITFNSYDPSIKQYTKTAERVILEAGAALIISLNAYSNKMDVEISRGTIRIPKNTTLYIPPSSGGSSSGGGATDATGTNAEIHDDRVKDEKGNVLKGWYTASDGTLAVRGGSVVVFGINAVYKQGSTIMGVTVTQNSVRLAVTDNAGVPVLVAADARLGATISVQGKSIGLNAFGVAGNTYETQTFKGIDGKEYRGIALNDEGKLEKHAKTWVQKVGKWVSKNWKIVVAAVVVVVAVVAAIWCPTILTFIPKLIAGLGTWVVGAAAAATVAASTLVAVGTMVIGAALIATGATMYGIGRITNTKWLTDAGVIVMAAGAVVAISGFASWAAAALKGVLGVAKIAKLGKFLSLLLKTVIQQSVISTGLFAVGRGINYIGERTGSEFLQDFGDNIGGGSWKIGFIWGAVGWEDGHFGFSKGWGINLGTLFIGNQTFKSLDTIKLPDGSEGFYEKTIKGFDISIPIGNINLGFSYIHSYDNIYGERWNIGANIAFGGNGKISGLNLGINVNYQEKDPYNTGQHGWTLGSNFGFRNMQIGASYNFTLQTIGFNLTYNFNTKTDQFYKNIAGLTIGGSYSFRNGDVSFNAGVKYANGANIGYNYSVFTDENGMRYVRKGVSISFDFRAKLNGKDADGNQIKLDHNYGNVSFSVNETKTYDRDGNLLDTTVTPSASMNINIEQLTSYLNKTKDESGNDILAPTLSSIAMNLAYYVYRGAAFIVGIVSSGIAYIAGVFTEAMRAIYDGITGNPQEIGHKYGYAEKWANFVFEESGAQSIVLGIKGFVSAIAKGKTFKEAISAAKNIIVQNDLEIKTGKKFKTKIKDGKKVQVTKINDKEELEVDISSQEASILKDGVVIEKFSISIEDGKVKVKDGSYTLNDFGNSINIEQILLAVAEGYASHGYLGVDNFMINSHFISAAEIKTNEGTISYKVVYIGTQAVLTISIQKGIDTANGRIKGYFGDIFGLNWGQDSATIVRSAIGSDMYNMSYAQVHSKAGNQVVMRQILLNGSDYICIDFVKVGDGYVLKAGNNAVIYSQKGRNGYYTREFVISTKKEKTAVEKKLNSFKIFNDALGALSSITGSEEWVNIDNSS
ncbi:MAG: hypothetical protein LBL00_02725, partial [Endomicrobium sp.]|nr:hypothetical protein [Endomicrobium sp.]